MSTSETIYQSINKDWFYYNEKHDKIYYANQKQLCLDFITESRKEQQQLFDEVEQLKLLIQQKEQQFEQLQMKKELIKDRIERLDNELQSTEIEKRKAPEYN